MTWFAVHCDGIRPLTVCLDLSRSEPGKTAWLALLGSTEALEQSLSSPFSYPFRAATVVVAIYCIVYYERQVQLRMCHHVCFC